jgi:hypothetical protein
MRTTFVEVLWVMASLVSATYCVVNLHTYVENYKITAMRDPGRLRTAYINVLTNAVRMVGAIAMLGSSLIAASLHSPVSEGWRAVSQLLLTTVAVALAVVPYLINTGVRGGPRVG